MPKEATVQTIQRWTVKSLALARLDADPSLWSGAITYVTETVDGDGNVTASIVSEVDCTPADLVGVLNDPALLVPLLESLLKGIPASATTIPIAPLVPQEGPPV